MSPKNKKKLNIQRRKLDKLDNRLLSLIKIRTEIIKKVISLKKNKKEIVDKRRIAYILRKVKKASIKRKIDPGKPNLTNMYELTPAQTKKLGIEILPQSLYEALDELDGDQVIKDSLGPIYDEFYDVKKREWNEYHSREW